jgi:hypothetical protein
LSIFYAKKEIIVLKILVPEFEQKVKFQFPGSSLHSEDRTIYKWRVLLSFTIDIKTLLKSRWEGELG